MAVQDGGWRGAMKDAARLISSGTRDLATGLVDLVVPPMAYDSREASASLGLTPEAWSQIVFLEDPVCEGCSVAFEIQPGEFGPHRCLVCIDHPFSFERARAACVYDAASRPVILGFKHGDQQQFASLFTRWVSRAAAPLLADADALVPVPLHPSRLLKRRFNQSAEIARPLARQQGLAYLPDALIRVRATAPQGDKSPQARRQNVKKAFAVKPSGRRQIKGRRILLVDDVFTTGATAEACAKALMAAGASAVDLAVVARVRNARDLPK